MNEDIKTINTNTTMSEEGYKIYGELKGFNKEKELTRLKQKYTTKNPKVASEFIIYIHSPSDTTP